MAKSSASSVSSASSTATDSASTAAALPALPASYEAALQELESLVGSLESGQLPLDQLLTGYQRGAQLLKFCRDKLEAVETQIKVLEGTELKPWVQA
jgi:exodeoxyribonuclease VII small subunit